MNNNYLKYFLIVAVIGVWAAIIMRVVHGMSADAAPAATPHVVPGDAPQERADTFGLYADYPDPFLPEADSVEADPPAKGALQPLAAITNVPGPLPITREAVAAIIQYNGIISNPQKKSRVAIITVQGKEYLVREKDRIGDIRIRKIGKEKILVFYKGEPFTIDK